MAHPTISGMFTPKACSREKLRAQGISGGREAIREFVREGSGRRLQAARRGTQKNPRCQALS